LPLVAPINKKEIKPMHPITRLARLLYLAALCAVFALSGLTARAIPTSTFQVNLGVAFPTGANVNDQYGNTWGEFELKYHPRALDTDFNGHSWVVGSDFFLESVDAFQDTYSFPYLGGFPSVNAEVQSVTLGYEAIISPKYSDVYFGGGLGLCFVNDSNDYQANHYWDEYSIGNDRTRLVPHLVAGCQITRMLGLEVKYAFVGSSLPATNNAFNSVFPGTTAARLNGVFSAALTLGYGSHYYR
jgi:hypothetical protein